MLQLERSPKMSAIGAEAVFGIGELMHGPSVKRRIAPAARHPQRRKKRAFKRHRLIARNSESEADGSRTRNHRIDSPIL